MGPHISTLKVRRRFLARYLPLDSVFVLPILDYCDVVWTPSSTTHFKQLERLDARFFNLCSTTCSSVSITLTELRLYHAAIQVYRTLHKLSPPYLHDSFHCAVDITSRAARNAHRLFVPRVRTTMAKNSFYFRGTQIWYPHFIQQGNWLTLNCFINHFYICKLCV